MDPRLQPGFLGTGASLMSDLSLLAYVLLIAPAMVVGFIFARRKLFRPYHKYTMMTITFVNWIIIAFLMVFSYSRGVVPGLPQSIGQPPIFIPTIHLLLGGSAQLLATYAVLRMLREERQVRAAKARGDKNVSRFYFKNAKPTMRLTLTLWLLTAAFGIITYFTFYTKRGVSASAPPAATPVVTPAATAPPDATDEGTPVVTPPPDATAEGTPVVTPPPEETSELNGEAMPVTTAAPDENATPATTPVVTPAVTPEALAVPLPVVTPAVTPELDAAPLPAVTPAVTPELVDTATDTPTNTPTSTRTPTPTATRRPGY